jgi:hypothetical protein
MNTFHGRLIMFLGLGLAILGVLTFLVQLQLEYLMAPWYMPVMALIGAALCVASLWQKRTVWRILALIVVIFLGGLELMALNAMRLPEYTGPVAVGHPFPKFEAKLADGTAFTQDDLKGDRHSVLVFFRGRW